MTWLLYITNIIINIFDSNFDGVKVLDYLMSVPGFSADLEYGRARACCVCSRCRKVGLFAFTFFFLFYPVFSVLIPLSGGTGRHDHNMVDRVLKLQLEQSILYWFL